MGEFVLVLYESRFTKSYFRRENVIFVIQSLIGCLGELLTE